MSMIKTFTRLEKERLISPPSWLLNNAQLLAVMGSTAYGCNTDTSDMDIQGFCMPLKDDIFPHLRGELQGFGYQHQRFHCWQQHHCNDASQNREYDFAVYSIVSFFQLCMDNNPNMLSILFCPERSLVQCTNVGRLVRDNRKLFLHTGAFRKFRGYAAGQLAKLQNGSNRESSKRSKSVELYGFDVYFAYHIVRLCLEAEQILMFGDLDIERDREIYKSIRRGEWSLADIKNWYQEKNVALEILMAKCNVVPDAPREDDIKQLLMNCLEEHFGKLSAVISQPEKYQNMTNELQAVLDKYR